MAMPVVMMMKLHVRSMVSWSKSRRNMCALALLGYSNLLWPYYFLVCLFFSFEFEGVLPS